ncbi:hypothetical protein LNP74_15150 [Klebsiella pneumoniae subsp. pneumoniae]|nr:hypothetical protein [Klebsiella pneumoniae subsp. pneumoniae]
MTATPVLNAPYRQSFWQILRAEGRRDLTVWPGEIHALMGGRTAPEKAR